MRTLDLIQGSDEWNATRAKHHTASEASIMMGASSKATRNDLLRMKATGSEQEFSRWVLEVLFERGHQVEAAARPIAEDIIGEELYPTTGVEDGGDLLASFDGVTLLEDAIWECKQWNEAKAAEVREDRVPAEDCWQVVQQLVVSRAERCLYMVTDGTEEGTVYTWVTLDPEDEARLRGGWAQFDEDLANYEHREEKPAVEGKAPENLPALRIEVEGKVTDTNLEQFRDHALAVFEDINKDLQSDQDFANAERTVKWCKDIEDRLAAAKDHAQAQMEDVDKLFRAVDDIRETARQTRLELDKLVKARKDQKRNEIVQEARQALQRHIESLDAGIQGADMPAVDADFAASIKGLKTIKSVRDAADQELARAKIAANEQAEKVRANLARYGEITGGEYATLFPDLQQLVEKPAEDMEATIKARIAEEEKRLEAERERVRQEEARKAEQAKAENTPESGNQEAQGAPTVAAAESGPAAAGAREKQAPAADDGARLKLSELNERIAPLSISADGLSRLGFEPVGREKAAKLYRASDFPAICEAMIRHLRDAQQSMQEAA